MDYLQNWKPIETFLVLHKRDVFGRIAAWISQIPLIVVFSVLCLVFFHRDLHTIFYAVGMLANEVICKVSKKIIRIPRPPTHPKSLVSSYGMPSNHATFMFFMVAYFSLFIKYRLSPRHYSSFARCFTVLFLFFISVITCYTRVYLEFHYVDQVCIGALFGSILGCLWFYVVQVILTPLFPRIVESKIGRTLMLQDFTHIPNIFTFEYNAVKASRSQYFCLSMNPVHYQSSHGILIQTLLDNSLIFLVLRSASIFAHIPLNLVKFASQQKMRVDAKKWYRDGDNYNLGHGMGSQPARERTTALNRKRELNKQQMPYKGEVDCSEYRLRRCPKLWKEISLPPQGTMPTRSPCKAIPVFYREADSSSQLIGIW
ncbi:Dolichyldiphosphatase 1 [Taenia solium]